MIESYKDKRTKQFANGDFIKAFAAFERQALKRLRVLECATCLNDLRTLPSNHLEALKGNRKSQYSIRINKQWRICFEWGEGQLHPSNVEIVDYH